MFLWVWGEEERRGDFVLGKITQWALSAWSRTLECSVMVWSCSWWAFKSLTHPSCRVHVHMQWGGREGDQNFNFLLSVHLGCTGSHSLRAILTKKGHHYWVFEDKVQWNWDTQKWRQVNWSIFMKCSHYLHYVLVCVCQIAGGLLTTYRKHRHDSPTRGKTSSWSMAPWTCHSFHATALPGQNWNSIYSILGKLFFCLCFNISRKKELCVSQVDHC